MYIDKLTNPEESKLALDLIQAIGASRAPVDPNDYSFQVFLVDEFVKRNKHVAKKIISSVSEGRIKTLRQLELVSLNFSMIVHFFTRYYDYPVYIYGGNTKGDIEFEKKFDRMLENMDRPLANEIYYICAVGMNAFTYSDKDREERQSAPKLLDIINSGSSYIWNNRDFMALKEDADIYYEQGLALYRTGNLPKQTKREYKQEKKATERITTAIVNIVKGYDEKKAGGDNSANISAMKVAMSGYERRKQYPYWLF